MEIKIKEIGFLEVFEVRNPVLRPGKPIESCRFDGDDLVTTKHFGCFEDRKLIGIVSVFENNSALFGSDRQFQLRGMAVLPNNQSKGIGKKLLDFAENYVRQQKGELIWFNARIGAVAFYQKSGYEMVGEEFDIPDVGLHLVMFKNLK